MKKLIDRIRNTDPRRAAIDLALGAVFVGMNWALMELARVAANSNPHNHQPGDGVPAGFMFGLVASVLLVDLTRRAEKSLVARFARKTAGTAE